MNVKPNRLIICALGASIPGTMGGNTKIAIEMARCLARHQSVLVFLPQYKLPTFVANLPSSHGITFHTLDDFPGDEKFQPLRCSTWYLRKTRELFEKLDVNSNDTIFSCSDFHMDVLPIYWLQRRFGFQWIPSVFLFIPFLFENLSRGYRFPAAKYVVYWVYQRILFALMKQRASAFVVTNTSDFCRFPQRFIGKIFAYYGGVNTEQIPQIKQSNNQETKQVSVVFCSRLHPQKGIDAFLDTWQLVIQTIQQSNNQAIHPRLSVIGNGEPNYETYLKNKANRLGISKTIDWLGYVNNEEKYAIYANADLFVHPTVFDNNGMVAAEALCTGLPVVMQDLPALRHVYTTGCRKVPFGDRTAFASAIVELATNPAKRAALAPTKDQIAALRSKWQWESRASEFAAWLQHLANTAK